MCAGLRAVGMLDFAAQIVEFILKTKANGEIDVACQRRVLLRKFGTARRAARESFGGSAIRSLLAARGRRCGMTSSGGGGDERSGRWSRSRVHLPRR